MATLSFTLCVVHTAIMRFSTSSALKPYGIRALCAYCFLFVTFCCLPVALSAQSLSLFNLDASRFPRLTASVFAYDAQGQQISVSPNFRLTEDGQQRMVTSYTCPAQQPRPVSAVLTIDISGSMTFPLNAANPNTSRLGVAKDAANAFVDALANDGSECAVVAFESTSYALQDFTTNKAQVKQVINSLNALNGTNYQAAFLNNPGGALAYMATAKHTNRAVIFLTDGLSIANANQIAQQALQTGTKVYCITIGLPVPPVLAAIVSRTQGQAFSNVQSTEEAVQIYRELASRIRINTPPCTIEWTSELPCRTDPRNVVLSTTNLPQNITGTASYTPPDSFESYFTISPRVLGIGEVDVNQSKQDSVTIQLRAGAPSVLVRSIRSDESTFRVLDSNFTLQAGMSRKVRVSYDALDSGYRFATFSVATDNGCTFNFYATAGFPGVRPTRKTLFLTHPNGFETFLVNTDTVITWKGLPPTEKVRLDYSLDAGKTWIFIDSTSTGLRRPWRVPNTPSDNCYMRVRQLNRSGAAFFNDSAVALMGHTAAVNSAQFNRQGDRIISAGEDGVAIYWRSDAELGKIIARPRFGPTPGPPVHYATFNSRTDIIAGGLSFPNLGILDGRGIEAGSMPEEIALQGLGNDAIRNLDANPQNADRFLAVTRSQTASIYIHDRNAPLPNRLAAILPLSEGAWNARYTPQITIDNGPQGSFLLYGIVAAVRSANESVRLWLFENRNERNAGIPVVWQSSHRAIYADAARDPANVANIRIAAACTDNKVRFVRLVSDSQGRPRLEQDMTIPEISHSAEIKMLSFDPSGNFLLTVSGSQAFIWRIGSTRPETVLNAPSSRRTPHKQSINTAFFSPDGNRVVTASNDNDTNVVVWFVKEPAPLQEDRSDNLWRIVRPRLTAENINMGVVALNGDKDSTALALSNPDLFPIDVTRIWFKTPNSPFSIISGDAPFTVKAATPPLRGQQSIEFRYTPTRVGVQTDSIFYLTSSGDTARALITGEGVTSSVEIRSPLIDWRERFVGTPNDTTQAIVVNRGTTPITIGLQNVIGANGSTFSRTFRVDGFVIGQNSVSPAPQQVRPGDSVQIRVVFTPPSLGPFRALLPLTVSQAGTSAQVELLGIGVNPGPRLNSTNSAPAPVVQGAGDCTTQRTMNIMLSNDGTLPLAISSAEILGADATPSRDFQFVLPPTITIGANLSGSINVRFTPQRIGSTSATLLIRSNSINGDVRIPLFGRWERPQLTFDRRLAVVGAVSAGRTDSVAVSVRNTGNVNTTVATPIRSVQGLFTISSSANGVVVSSNGTATNLNIRFLGGLAGRTYQDSIIIPSACAFDTLLLSATVDSAPLIEAGTSATLETCSSSATFSLWVRNRGTAVGTVRLSLEPPTTPAVITTITGQRLDSLRLNVGDSLGLQVQMNTLARAEQTAFAVVFRETTSASVNTRRVQISVTKRDVGFTISPRTFSFLGLDANVATSAVVTITNRSSQPLTLPQRPFGGTVQLRLESPLTVLPPYASVQARVVFSGANFNLTFDDFFVFTPQSVSGFGCGVAPDTVWATATTLPPSTAHLVFTNASASPGDTALVRVYLRDRTRIPLGTVITDELRYNVSLLQPIAPLPFGRVEFGERIIPLRFEVKSDDPNVPLDEWRFRAALGNDTATALRLMKTPETRAEKMTITASTATFRLTGIARAGGLRLIISSMGTLRILDARPNPTSSELTLEFFSKDAEEYQIYLINPIGLRPDPAAFPEQRFTATAGVNIRTLDLSRVPSGIYFLQLRNVRELATRRIVIMR